MTDEQIEKAEEYAKNYPVPPFFTPDAANAVHVIAKSSYMQGAQDTLASQWVSVEEWLPEDGRYCYLVADARMNPLGVDCAEYTCETKLFSRNGKVLHPTHWMPIPPLNPEKQSK